MANPKMQFLKVPPQVFRLVLLAVAIVGSYLIARYFLTPSSFGQYGWYRGDALTELASQPVTFAGREACQECHYDEYEMLIEHGHKTLSCEACHGSGQAHADDPDINISISSYGQCVRCHEANPSRPAWQKQIDPKDHFTGDTCIECHVPHAPEEVPEDPEEEPPP